MTVITAIDLDTAHLAAVALVDTKPEGYVYKIPEDRYGCSYTSKDEPSCLLGHLFVQWGVPLQRLREIDNQPVRSFIGGKSAFYAIPALQTEGYLLGLTEMATEFLVKAQALQDSGYSWAESVDRAYAEVAA